MQKQYVHSASTQVSVTYNSVRLEKKTSEYNQEIPANLRHQVETQSNIKKTKSVTMNFFSKNFLFFLNHL